MSTKYTNIRGIAKWAHVYKPDAAFGQENYKINVYLHGEELEKFKALGLLLTIKEDAEGKFVTLRRTTKRVFDDEVTFFTPPSIRGKINVVYTDNDGNEIRQYKKGSLPVIKGEQREIGNGSEVSVNISYFDTAKGKGHRLESVTVLNLIEYDGSAKSEASQNSPEEKTTEGKETIKETKKETKRTVSDELDDSLPW